MTDRKPTSSRADYDYQKPGVGAKTRTQITGPVSQHLHGATMESAVLNDLRAKHPGYEILLMSLDWT